MEKPALDLLDLIKIRKSIRKYKSQDVPEEYLRKILETRELAGAVDILF